MRDAGDHAGRDDRGRLIIGNPDGCPSCGTVRSFTAQNGKAIIYTLSDDCCDARREQVRRNPRKNRRSRP